MRTWRQCNTESGTGRRRQRRPIPEQDAHARNVSGLPDYRVGRCAGNEQGSWRMDWTWHIGDLVMAGIGLVLIPIAKTLVQMRDTLNQIAPKVPELERRVDRHHEWLILLRGKNGS